MSIIGKILKFADDTNTLFRKIKGNGGKQKFQDDIVKLIKWSEKLQDVIQFNIFC